MSLHDETSERGRYRLIEQIEIQNKERLRLIEQMEIGIEKKLSALRKLREYVESQCKRLEEECEQMVDTPSPEFLSQLEQFRAGRDLFARLDASDEDGSEDKSNERANAARENREEEES